MALSENNHLQIAEDPTVSGNHACLIFEHDVLGIYDYKSTNGTRVNGEVVKEKRHLLRPGDRIQIGRSTFAIQLDEQEGHERVVQGRRLGSYQLTQRIGQTGMSEVWRAQDRDGKPVALKTISSQAGADPAAACALPA